MNRYALAFGLSTISLFTIVRPTAVVAAEITEVADAADGDDPFDFELEVGWSRTQVQAKITREHLQTNPRTGQPDIVDVTELRYRDIRSQLDITARAGLYKDLELHATLPIVFLDAQAWWPAKPLLDAGLQNSTLYNDEGICPGGQIDAACRGPLFPFTDDTGQNNSYRGGLGDGSVGLTWGIMNDERDRWSPSLNIGFDWTFPSGAKRSPLDVSHSEGDLKPVGLKTHLFSFHIATSKNMGGIDPFLKFYYHLPIANPEQAFHNCEAPDRLADMDDDDPGVQNTCSVGSEWRADGENRGGLRPSHVGGFRLGSEFLPYYDPAQFIRVAIELSFGAAYVSEGRNFSELSDALQRTTWTGDFLRLDGRLGVRVRASRYAQFHVLATLGHDTEHQLTGETIGKDLGYCVGQGGQLERRSDCAPVVDLTPNEVNPERNPNYDFRFDQPGRRFRIEELTRFTIFIGGEVDF